MPSSRPPSPRINENDSGKTGGGSGGKAGRHMMHIANVVCCQFPVVAAAILFMHEHECDCDCDCHCHCNCHCSKKKADESWWKAVGVESKKCKRKTSWLPSTHIKSKALQMPPIAVNNCFVSLLHEACTCKDSSRDTLERVDISHDDWPQCLDDD
uniref:HDC02913 n=1 Tax=Drosophila melanogaster TaxID=7227 RepID=Q6IHA5_DROME|nr:TPA_inf: HDC02913 [Drosophila melanogaster]